MPITTQHNKTFYFVLKHFDVSVVTFNIPGFFIFFSCQMELTRLT